MADLSPNVSIYQHEGLGGMDLNSLMGLVSKGRELQTQQAVSDQLKQTGGDPNATLTNMLKPGSSGYVTPELVQHLSSLGQFYTENSAKALGALYAKAISKKGASSQDLDDTSAIMAGYHIPPNMITELRRQAERPDGSVNPDALLRFWNVAHPETPMPMVNVQTPGGVSGQMPAATAQYNAGQGGFVPQTIPGAAESAAAAPVTSAAQFVTAQKNAETYQDDIQPLKHVHQLGTELGEQGLGKGTGVVNDLQNFLIASGADKYTDFDKNKTYNYQELQKYVRRYADQVSQGGTDARLMQAVGGNPNVGMNQQPFLSVMRYIIAMRRMKQVQFNEYSASHQDPATGNVNAGQFGPWSSKFLQAQDPRAYAFDLMGPDKAAALYK